MSRAPRNEKTETTRALTTKTAIDAWTKTCSRSPRRTPTIPAIPPRKMYVVNSSEPPFTAPPMIATMAMTMVASDASSRIARSIAIAAVGRKNGRRRPAGRDLERERRPDDEQADQDQHVVAVPERPAGSARSRPAACRRRGPRAGTSRRSCATSGSRLAEPERVDLLDVASASSCVAVADDDLALEDRDRGPATTAAAALPRAWSVSSAAERRVRDDERGDELGGEHPLRLVEPAGHLAGEARPGLGRPPCRGARSAAVASRTRAASVRTVGPAGRRRGRRASPGPRRDRSGTAVSRRVLPAPRR